MSKPAAPGDPGEKPTLEAAVRPGSARRASMAERNRRRAWLLSLAGFVPFAFLAVGLLVMDVSNPQRLIVVDTLKTYAAIILSFLGGIRWGASVRHPSENWTGPTFTLSVVPSLVGWAAIFLSAPLTFGVLALAFAAQGAWDAFSAQQGRFGLWFARLRTVLTLLVVGVLLVSLFATAI